MPGLEMATTVCLFLMLSACAWVDVRERLAPNFLTVGGLFFALVLGALNGWAGLGAAVGGAMIALLVALPLFLAGGLGGGDVKLMAATGAFLGPAELPAAFVAIALVGGIMAAVEVIRRGAVRRTLINFRLIVVGLRWSTFSRWQRGESDEALTIHAPAAVTVPYAMAIALGVGLARVVPRLVQ